MKTPVPYLTIRSIAKGLIAVIVVFGLFRAIRKAVDEVEETNTQIEDRSAEIERQLADGQSLTQRQALQNELSRLHRERFSWTSLRFAPLIGAIALNMIGLFFAGEYWRKLLLAVGAKVPRSDLQEAYFLGHLAKYSPGKALTVIVRVERLRAIGVPRTVAFTSVVIETLNFMAVGALVGCVAAYQAKPPIWMVTIAVTYAVAAILLTFPGGLRLVLHFGRKTLRLAGGIVGNRKGFDRTVGILEAIFAPYAQASVSWRTTVEGWLLMVVGWLFLAAALHLCALGVVTPSLIQAFSITYFLPIALTVVGLSTVLGFLTFLPGGVGARELVVITLLGPVMGLAPALVTAVVNRLCAIVAELLSYLLFKNAARTRNRKNQLSATEPTT